MGQGNVLHAWENSKEKRGIPAPTTKKQEVLCKEHLLTLLPCEGSFETRALALGSELLFFGGGSLPEENMSPFFGSTVLMQLREYRQSERECRVFALLVAAEIARTIADYKSK